MPKLTYNPTVTYGQNFPGRWYGDPPIQTRSGIPLEGQNEYVGPGRPSGRGDRGFSAFSDPLVEQRRLAMILKAGGDPRLGGSLPLGGKPYAWSTKGPSSPVNYMMGVLPHPDESKGYDAYMNMVESMLEDMRRGGR